jgi:hypothetical protein
MAELQNMMAELQKMGVELQIDLLEHKKRGRLRSWPPSSLYPLGVKGVSYLALLLFPTTSVGGNLFVFKRGLGRLPLGRRLDQGCLLTLAHRLITFLVVLHHGPPDTLLPKTSIRHDFHQVNMQAQTRTPRINPRGLVMGLICEVRAITQVCGI